MPADLLSAGVRAGWLLALLQGTGGALFLAFFGSRLGPSAPPVRALALEAVRMAAAWDGVLDPELRALVWDGQHAAIVARIGGLALLASSLGGRGGALAAVAGTLAVASSFALTGHTSTLGLGPRALIVLHVLVAAFWAGSLLPLVLVTRHEDGAVAGDVVARFTRVATPTVPLIAVAGAGLAYQLGVRAETFARPYGLLLLAKLGAFGLLMLLAAMNKWRLGPRLAGGTSTRSAFVRSVVGEAVLIGGVVVATATLTTYFSPDT